MTNSSRIILNTSILYVRLVLSAIITLYTTRIILSALGISDFGIYSLTAGFVAMMAFLNSSLTASTQRYISFELGKSDSSSSCSRVNEIFNASFFIHIILALIIVSFAETAGLFLFNNYLVIPEEKIISSNIVFHAVVISLVCTIIAIPYQAIINAHENMLFYSLLSLFDNVAKLIIALSLFWINGDKLIWYGYLLSIESIIILTIIICFCKIYPETKITNILTHKKALLKDLLGFAGWNTFGAFGGIIRTQALTILFNMFFGLIANAAYGIAGQLMAQFNIFSSTIMRAITPQITKNEGAGNREHMLKLSIIGNKITIFLITLIAIPAIIQMPTILKLWLKNIPQYTILFCRLTLIIAIIDQFTISFLSTIQSVGKIKWYQITMSSVMIFTIPIVYFGFKFKLNASFALYTLIGISLVLSITRMYFVNKLAGISIQLWFRKVASNAIITISSSLLFGFYILPIISNNFIELNVLTNTSIIIICICVSFFIQNKEEKEFIYVLKDKFLKRNSL